MAGYDWDLSTIYPGFDSIEFTGDMDSVTEDIRRITAFSMTPDFDVTAEAFLDLGNKILRKLYPLGAFSNLTFAADTSNETAFKFLSRIEEAAASLTEPFVKFEKWLSGFEPSAIMDSSNPAVMQHRYYLTTLREEAAYLLSDAEEILLAKLQTVGSNAWSSLQAKLTSDLMIDFQIDGEKTSCSLSMIRNFANSADKDIRKRAYEAEIGAYRQIDEAVAASVNSIKGEVNLISKLRGFQSPLVESAFRSRLDIEAVNAMMEAIREKLPSFCKYLKRKAALLGHKGSLPFYDLFAPVSSSSLTYTYEEAKDFIIRNFGSFSRELADYAKTAFDNGWIDVEPKKGKTGGAFCAHVEGRRESRILTNFDGTFSAVSTLAHELGHGYHNSMVYDESMLNMNYPMPVGETASIFCETIVCDASFKEASGDDAIFILEKSIENSTQVIVDILSRFIFEKNLFESRENGPLSVRELNALMIDAQKEAYGDGLDPDYLHPYMWLCKSHYYSAGFSFYNYPYAFGLLFGKGLYAIFKAGEPDFIARYNRLLNSTVKMDAAGTAATMGIDISRKEFWIESLGIIEEEIESFLRLTEKYVS
ncbi:MAG: M3 family oligoendopeptidase [Saccharofermentanales bacterium]